MPNNCHVAGQRVLCLKREYVHFLCDVINKGYTDMVPEHQLEGKEGKVL